MQITLRILLAVFSFSCVAAAARAELKPEWLTFGAGDNEVLDNDQVAFASVELRFTPVVAGLRPWVYANTSAEGSFYVGAGLAYTFAGSRAGARRWASVRAITIAATTFASGVITKTCPLSKSPIAWTTTRW